MHERQVRNLTQVHMPLHIIELLVALRRIPIGRPKSYFVEFFTLGQLFKNNVLEGKPFTLRSS
jgi:hypothetical protein